jgi:NADH-quinone oxidoreductase subunit H
MNPITALMKIFYICAYVPTDTIIEWISDIFNLSIDVLLHLPQYTMEFLTVNIKPILQIVVLPGLLWVIVYAVIAVWFERKLLARAMLRVGPYYCGGRAGWLQLIADFMKLFFKEIIIPRDVNWLFFLAMPVLLPSVPALAVILIPFDANWVLWDIGGMGLPMFFAIAGIAPLIPIFAGWASNNKYSFIGAWRVAYMYISAEIPMVICGAAVAIMAGSFNLVDIVEAQQNMWFFIPQFIGFVIFFLGVFIESERTPFDMPGAETELVLGWRTEYSGVLYGFVMFTEYVMLQAWALLFITLYLGGYNGPVLFGAVTASHIFWMILKFVILVTIVIFSRVVFPRLRMDQMLKLGWYYLTPLAVLNLIFTLALKMWGVY